MEETWYAEEPAPKTNPAGKSSLLKSSELYTHKEPKTKLSETREKQELNIISRLLKLFEACVV